LGRCEGDAIPEPSVTLRVPRGIQARIPLEWHPGVGVDVEHASGRRENADNLERSPADRDPAADDVRIAAESRLPQSMAEHDDAGVLRRAVFGLEQPAIQGRTRSMSNRLGDGRVATI